MLDDGQPESRAAETPGQLVQVRVRRTDQSELVDAAEVEERAVIGQILDHASDDCAFLQALEQRRLPNEIRRDRWGVQLRAQDRAGRAFDGRDGEPRAVRA